MTITAITSDGLTPQRATRGALQAYGFVDTWRRFASLSCRVMQAYEAGVDRSTINLSARRALNEQGTRS